MKNLQYGSVWKRINEKYDVHKHPKLSRFLIQVRSEWDFLCSIAETRNIQYGMEIGTNAGGTFYALCQLANDDATLITLDLTNGPYVNCDQKELVFKNEFPKAQQKLCFIHDNSTYQKSIDSVRDILGNNELDYLFIDGDHSYDGVKQDYLNYKDFVKDTGIIVFHDIKGDKNNGSCRFWHEIKEDHKYIEISFRINTMGIGIIFD